MIDCEYCGREITSQYMTYQNKCNNVPKATGAQYEVSMGKISY